MRPDTTLDMADTDAASARNTAISGRDNPVSQLGSAGVDGDCFCWIAWRKLLAIDAMLVLNCMLANQVTVDSQCHGDDLPQRGAL